MDIIPVVKNSVEIKKRIDEIESRLQLIEVARKKALEVPFFKRNWYLFHFLNLERKIYSRCLQELKWVLNE